MSKHTLNQGPSGPHTPGTAAPGSNPPSTAHQSLKQALDGILDQVDRCADRDRDPVGLVHQMPPEDQEVGGFMAAMFAFGRTASIRNTVQKLFTALTGNEEGRGLKKVLLSKGADRDLIQKTTGPMRHRWIGPEDFSSLVVGLASMLGEHHTIEEAFKAHWSPFITPAGPGPGADGETGTGPILLPPEAMAGAITGFNQDLLSRTGSEPTRGIRWLLPSPRGGSAAKRFCLFLRWMCRPPDPIDLGLWTSIHPGSLVIPLDVHVHRIARRLGLTDRKSGSWRTAVEITRALAVMDREDPLKYDFAICHLGVRGDCPSQPDQGCVSCPARLVCLVTNPPRP